jgi:hypothetical protein
VKIFTPGQSDAQSILDAIEKEQGGKDGKYGCNKGQWASGRYALLFEPGTHNVDAAIGYY